MAMLHIDELEQQLTLSATEIIVAGVAADIARNIFVPFFTTKREGSGVGLALTRQVMLAHGGTMTLGESDSGGAKFTLSFLANTS